ncbi:Cys-tRNA(Pro) deacylase [Amaricoccus solimangrovi]|uniref:Cys-tRNA(Pro)/Cys-tRNA(Cys) deacylase n=1 Tax=Amaricoccus solimangrovi TaxID=2589815 RepID=A0A501WR84_9RHOB|nr:Cys-tRNA(Pro) deacylase [Amaricoccus solimangrovi]TPE48276.1 Cys-tRNA(Pro) deacylase [Amaricoccus solimangrovi]
MTASTQATRALTGAGITFGTYAYAYSKGSERIGEQAAAALGRPPEQVFKTLMLEVDGEPRCVVVPVAASVSMKRAAAVFCGKSARMMEPAKAERLTGYVVGGISPLGQKRRVPVALDDSAMKQAEIVVNGGRRGFMIALGPEDLRRATGAEVARLTAD